jgi:hypothetical protein
VGQELLDDETSLRASGGPQPLVTSDTPLLCDIGVLTIIVITSIVDCGGESLSVREHETPGRLSGGGGIS